MTINAYRSIYMYIYVEFHIHIYIHICIYTGVSTYILCMYIYIYLFLSLEQAPLKLLVTSPGLVELRVSERQLHGLDFRARPLVICHIL